MQERRVARRFGGSTTPGSGNGWVRKADVRTDKYLIECKTTTKESYRITLDTWEKIWKEALTDDRIPVMIVDIDGTEIMIADPTDFMIEA